jgi:hypothetical protein
VTHDEITISILGAGPGANPSRASREPGLWTRRVESLGFTATPKE